MIFVLSMVAGVGMATLAHAHDIGAWGYFAAVGMMVFGCLAEMSQGPY